ncbi:MAG TPA: universal stress protein [Flavitalea sp.]|nr:universal stress protein [Flavitalea sp.]
MPEIFYNIMVPVDFTARTKWAVAKAIELANNLHCNIHLVHVVSKQLLPFVPFDASHALAYDITADLGNARYKLEQLRDDYRAHLCEGSNLEISLLHGNKSAELTRYIKQFRIDLVVIGLPRFNLIHRVVSAFSLTSLGKKANVPTLAVRSSGLVSHFKKIVLPIHNNIPVQRIRLATMLARSFRSTVYLVSLRKDASKGDNLIQKALEVLQSISTIPAQCFLLEGKNLAKSTLEFSKKINADLIMANQLKEFNMPGSWNRLTKKILSYGSNIPVITVDKSEAISI